MADIEYYRVIYNTTYGGFRLPDDIVKKFKEEYGEEICPYSCSRTDERIIQMVHEADWFEDSDFAIKYIPVDCEHHIHEYDGRETVSWNLPKDKIIDDLRMLLIGEVTNESVSQLTKQFLEFGGTFDKFDKWFRMEFGILSKTDS